MLDYARNVNVEDVDERDSSWEEYEPRFRVYLFQTVDSKTTVAPIVWTYDITDADAIEVIDWAQNQAGRDRLFAVALVSDKGRPPRRGLTWLVGMDANDEPRNETEVKALAAMLARRERQEQ